MREPTPIDAIAESYVDALVEHSPLTATGLGIPGHDHLVDDLSPDAGAAWAQVERDTLAQLAAAEVQDATDMVTVAAMRDRLGLSIESHEAGDHKAQLNNIASPLQALHEVFDLMPTDSDDDWAAVASRMHGIPAALDGWIETLREGMRDGVVPSQRAVADGVAQARQQVDPRTSRFHDLASHSGVDGPGRRDLDTGASTAASAYGRLVEFLTDELAPRAPQEDAVGRERYARASREFIGARIDLDETYEWGVEALGHITEEQESLAREIAGPGATVADAVRTLNADPATQLHSTEALQEWMQATSQWAIEELDGVHFDIPEPVKTLECRIAPSQTGAIYYTGPAEDWSRPGSR